MKIRLKKKSVQSRNKCHASDWIQNCVSLGKDRLHLIMTQGRLLIGGGIRKGFEDEELGRDEGSGGILG